MLYFVTIKFDIKSYYLCSVIVTTSNLLIENAIYRIL